MSRKKSKLGLNQSKTKTKKPSRQQPSPQSPTSTLPHIEKTPYNKRKNPVTPFKRIRTFRYTTNQKSPTSKSPLCKRQKKNVGPVQSLFGGGIKGASNYQSDRCCNSVPDIQAPGVESPVVRPEITQPNHDNAILLEITELLPAVLNILKEENRLDSTILGFFRQVKNGTFPLKNMSFLLFCDVVKWFGCRSTTSMRYSDESKTFWKLGYRLFGERFVHFMGGPKNHGQLLQQSSEPGQFIPQCSKINFAVPDPKILRTFDPYNVQGGRQPGIYTDIIQELSKALDKKSACLTFDGKKLKQGLTSETGDVDLLGFEQEESLAGRRSRLERSMSSVNALQDTVINCLPLGYTCVNLKLLPVSCKEEVRLKLLQYLQDISESIFSADNLKKKKEYCKTKLIERGGEQNWRNSRYVYAISATIAFLSDIDSYLRNAREVVDKVIRHVSFLNESDLVEGSGVNLDKVETYLPLPDKTESTSIPRLVKQRSDEWHQIRSQAKVTGSTLFDALGCSILEKQKNNFDKVMCGVPEKEPSPEIKSWMEHGTRNEPNAVSTIVGKVMPVLEPTMVFCEEGCVPVNDEKGDIFMVVSPDGSLRTNKSLNSTAVAIEIKCPVRSVHSVFPARYLLQCLSEIEALNVEYLLYASWTEKETTIFTVERDTQLFTTAMKIAMNLYCTGISKRPVKLSPDQIQLREDIKKKSQNVQLVGVFPSTTVSDSQHGYDSNEYTTASLFDVLNKVIDLKGDFYELKRERATEAVVFLVADLDRSWKKDTIRCAPVSWFPKGYSLSTDSMRHIAEYVHNECHSRGIHIPCSSFDGQWHKLVVRTEGGEPLTLLQLQKDVWHEVENRKRRK